MLCVGCATRREKAITYMNDNPDDLAALCASNFPPKIEYKPGKTIHTSDTVYTEGEKIPCPPNEKGEVVYVRGRNMIVRDTVFKTDFQYTPVGRAGNERIHDKAFVASWATYF